MDSKGELDSPKAYRDEKIKNLISGKSILDVCCGSRMFWFDKKNTNTLFMDIRSEEFTACDGRKVSVSPDLVADFRQIPLPSNHFRLVVFDPPHLNKLGKNSWLAQKYGMLFPTWETDIKQGFYECYRVLRPGGILVFKWSAVQISVKKILQLCPYKPLFGHTTSKKGNTRWFVFMKSIEK